MLEDNEFYKIELARILKFNIKTGSYFLDVDKWVGSTDRRIGENISYKSLLNSDCKMMKEFGVKHLEYPNDPNTYFKLPIYFRKKGIKCFSDYLQNLNFTFIPVGEVTNGHQIYKSNIHKDFLYFLTT